MGKTSGRIHLKVNLKAKFSPFATVVNDTGGAPSSEYLCEFSKKIRNGRNGILRRLGETDS